MRNKQPSVKVLQELYLRWLKGESLRKIARSVGVRHQSLDLWFDRVFGSKATCPTANSLVRSMLEDYPNSPEVYLWAMSQALHGEPETIQHRSNHSIQQLTKFQCLHDDNMMSVIATTEDKIVDPWDQVETGLDFLRLPLYLMVTQETSRALLAAGFMALAREHRELNQDVEGEVA